MIEIPWQVRAVVTGVGMGVVIALVLLAAFTLLFAQSLPAGYPVPWYQADWFVWLVTGVVSSFIGITTTIFCWKLERRGARRDAGLCVSCGYCLTENVSGVCPECGSVIERQS